MCGAGHREVKGQAVAESTVDSLQDWLAPHQGVEVWAWPQGLSRGTG